MPQSDAVLSGSCATNDGNIASTLLRPTPAELQEAIGMIKQMKQGDPALLAKTAPAKPNVVACAIALTRGEKFADDREALRLFNAHPETRVREVWINKLDEFMAGLGTPGPAVPTYLLDRGELAFERPVAEHVVDLPSYVDLESLRARWASQAALDGCEEALERDECKLRKELAPMAQREHEFREWEAANGVQHEAAINALAAEEPIFYWALPHEVGRTPKWQLRKGESLEADRTRTLGTNEHGIHEPLLLYRDFRPFKGNVLKAQHIFDQSVVTDHAWLDSERARLEAGPSDTTRSSAPRCIECGNCECVCPDPDDPIRSDFFGGGSADINPGEPLDRLAVQECEAQQQHEQREQSVDRCNEHALEQDRELERQGRIAAIADCPWDQVREGSTVPASWLNSTDDGGAVDRPWEKIEREQRAREEREYLERLECAAHAGTRPPRREQYGPLANNPDGDQRFRDDRAAWYAHVTGESIEHLSLTAQWELCDVFARRFREHNDHWRSEHT